jgi:CRP/FNR family transcriptional regulator, dissimilatory nitrate respiration regulator
VFVKKWTFFAGKSSADGYAAYASRNYLIMLSGDGPRCPPAGKAAIGSFAFVAGPGEDHHIHMANSVAELRQAAIANTLRSCQLFAGLAPADLNAVADITAVKPLDKGAYLFREGEMSRGFYVVQKGAINVHRVNAAGREQVIHIFRAGESFAEAALATLSGYPADARAVEPSQVLLVQKDGFLALLRRQPELALRMLGSMSLHLRVLVAQLEDMTLKDVETRLANWLINRCPDPGSRWPATVELKTTKRVLAAELGTVSETLSRTLARFREQKLVAVKGKTVTVLSPDKLGSLLRRNLGG